MPETLVTRVPKRAFRPWLMQLVRWERSTIRSFLRSTWMMPQVRRDPLLARKTLEKVFRDVLVGIHLWAWVVSAGKYRMLTFALMGYYVWNVVQSQRAFFREYLYMSRYWWAVLIADRAGVIIAPWVWLTVGVDEWHISEKAASKKN